MTRTAVIILILTGITSVQCRKNSVSSASSSTIPVRKWVGFNQNWSFLPPLSSTLYANVRQLKPQMIRYPGGTVAHDWDWATGQRRSALNTTPHPATDIKALADATGATMIFVLDIVHSTIGDQLAMLQAAAAQGVPVEYIELGNELYANDAAYIAVFPAGADYANRVNQWVPVIRAAFPSARIAALLQCRNADASNLRLRTWNSQVASATSAAVDAYTYHIYIPVGGSFDSRKSEFEAVVAATQTGTKELWVTEYGNQNELTDAEYYRSLDSLADYVERHPKVTVALNHLIVGNSKNKLTPDGMSFTPEGQLYLNRASKRK